MGERDPELTRILLSELERHLQTLIVLVEDQDIAPATLESARRTIHALKGSAGLAGEPALATAMQGLERRLRAGENDALAEAADVVRRAIRRLASGQHEVSAPWPTPPSDLVAAAIDPAIHAHYTAESTDRLARIDDALAGGQDPETATTDIYRHIHTLKGAASAAGDEPMAWFCHGLEERLRGDGPDWAKRALEEVVAWRSILGMLHDDSAAALATLRGLVAPAPPREGRAPGRTEDERREGADTIRIAALSVDQLLDHASGIAVARERVGAQVVETAAQAREARRLRTELEAALRLIGPPRPWGAPAAALRRIEKASQTLGGFGHTLDTAAEQLKLADLALKDDANASKKILTTMRQTPIGTMFARLSAAVHAEARRTGRALAVKTYGAEEPVDRRLVDRLVEPCLQLARNAIAHGIESPDAREALGKSREATLTFRARRSGSRLSVAIADDGAGVDVAAVRTRAVESGVVTEVLAEAADDETLLELLFLPGFSMRSQSPDLLAGRGIGLDITLASVQRLGGSIHLSSRRGLGFEARIDVPIEAGLGAVLWIESGGVDLAIPAFEAKRVRKLEDVPGGERIPHLAACLEPRLFPAPRFVVELSDHDDEGGAFGVGIDAVGAVEEVLIRPLSPLLWGLGPYAGAIIRGDGSIRLALDVHALAPRARALGRVSGGHVSDPPSRPPSSRRSSP